MKVIELLNKIAKGEEIPKKIKVFGYEWLYEPLKISSIPYYSVLGNYNIVDCLKIRSLNDEVEIIEEEQDINVLELQENISKLQSEIDLLSNEIGSYHNKIHSMRDRNNYMKEQLKELIKAVNELKKNER